MTPSAPMGAPLLDRAQNFLIDHRCRPLISTGFGPDRLLFAGIIPERLIFQTPE